MAIREVRMKTVIIGIGGVGGYFGGLLSLHYTGQPGHEVCFISRGDQLNAIRQHGLRIISDGDQRVVHPDIVISSTDHLGKADLVILAVKSYSLESVLPLLHPICGPNTVVIPVQNGLGNTEKIRAACKTGIICDGLVYVIAEVKQPGVVIRQGDAQKIIFGLQGTSHPKLEGIRDYLKEPGFDVVLTEDPLKYKWLKFQFIGALSVVAAAHDMSIGEVLKTPKTSEAYIAIMEEIRYVAKACGIRLPENAAEKSYEIAMKSPAESTTSFQRDYLSGKPHELEAYLGELLLLAHKHQIPVPMSETYYRKLKD